MRFENVNVRVERANVDNAPDLDEVFITCNNPYLNQCIHLQGDFAGKIETGVYSLTFSKIVAPEPIKTVKTLNSAKTSSADSTSASKE